MESEGERTGPESPLEQNTQTNPSTEGKISRIINGYVIPFAGAAAGWFITGGPGGAGAGMAITSGIMIVNENYHSEIVNKANYATFALGTAIFIVNLAHLTLPRT